MNEKFLKPYSPSNTEERIYKLWAESGFFNPDKLPERHQKPFSIVLPPPNATGTLHIGGAIMTVVEDIIIRYKRMCGFKTLWLPGTDHAAIATNSKVEKILLEKEGKSRHDLGREAFVMKVEEFVEKNRGELRHQISKMGASLDWSREAFTLDKERNLAVRTAFKKMYEAGLIYRGERITNWDPKGQTTIADDEVVYKEEKTKFYYLKYGPFVIGTSRPETKFGDKYVVMHPDDKRYKQYKHGDQINLEWINGPIIATVIKDEAIDMEFGTGVMTITPWHSQVDFEIAERHHLDKEQIIDKYGRLLPIAGEFAEQKITVARLAIIKKLREKGLVEKEENYTHNVAMAERTGGIIEPQIMTQWFIDVNKPIKERENKSLKELMRESVTSGDINILPKRFEKVYFHWIDNLHDWNISRQIWYGHRIPAWYQDGETYVGVEPPEGSGWEQDPDTLDTWFSSGLWTFSTLGWPNKTKDLKLYHPTDVLETGYDILFFWVARMILMSQFLLGEIPFKKVYLHGLVRNEKGEKISKSLGGNLDPLEIANKYGTDALRMALIVGVGPGSDSKLSNDKLKAYKNFANKIWNIARFVLSQKKSGELKKELVKEFDALKEDITEDMENFCFYLAAEKIYHYVWHRFADEILEESKGQQTEYSATLYYILENSLKLLHPFMPFITEEIWQELKPEKLLMIEPWA
ncbi:MAG: valine--tRNA ligase [bacterium]